MAALHITDIEAAINWWRERSPSPDGITACAEVRALAEVYALLVVGRERLACVASPRPRRCCDDGGQIPPIKRVRRAAAAAKTGPRSTKPHP